MKDFIGNNIAKNIKNEAKAAGISINLLCKKADIARTTFQRWINGSNSPTFSKIQEINEALNSLIQEQATANTNNP